MYFFTNIRKLNSFVSVFSAFFIFSHIIFTSLLLFGIGNFIICKLFAEIAAIFTLLHIVFGFIIFFSQRGAFISVYKIKNLSTLLQRFTAAAMLVMLKWHMNAMKFVGKQLPLEHGAAARLFICELFFFGCVLVHLSLSFPKALIGLGIIDSDEKENKAKALSAALCFILYILCVIALYTFLYSWPKV